MSDPRYPIGKFVAPAAFTLDLRGAHLAELAACPAALGAALAGLAPAQLDTPYRAGGWTVRQVAFHLPDSHANAYVRHRLCVTEAQPTIRAYDEKAWAETPDVLAGDVALPLTLLSALHARWVGFLSALPDTDFARTFVHGATGKVWSLDESLAMYAWHGRHHVTQITALRARMGW